MTQPQIYVATPSDAFCIKQMINQMYGFEYETCTVLELGEVIQQQNQIYVLAKQGQNIIGFAGATTNSTEYANITNKTKTVIEYIYIIPTCRNFFVAFELAKKLLTCLVEIQKTSAILQVQTFNKQRFFHYALCDKNIIHSKCCQTKTGKIYHDQILLVDDITTTCKQTANQFMKKVKKYKSEN